MEINHLLHKFWETSGGRSSSRALWTAAGYLVFLCVAEIFVAFNLPQIGFPLHGLILIMLLTHSAITGQVHQRGFLLVFSLLPLIRLISLLMPVRYLPLVYWYPVISAPVLVAAYLIIRTLSINRQEIGLNHSALPLQILVSLSGILFGYLAYQIRKPAPLIPALQWEQFWLPACILIIFAGFQEEFIFRGLLQSRAAPYLKRLAIPYTALVFAILHLSNQSVLDFMFVLLVGLFFGYMVKRSGSILGVSMAHGLINVMLFLILPFLIPGPVASQSLTPILGTDTTSLTATLPNTTTSIPITPSPTAVPSQTPAIVLKTLVSPRSTAETPQATLITTPISEPCLAKIPARLQIGQGAEVLTVLNLRSEPGTHKSIIGSSGPGGRVEIIGGPVCLTFRRGTYRWWNVMMEDGRTGWMAEGSLNGQDYFLAPLK